MLDVNVEQRSSEMAQSPTCSLFPFERTCTVFHHSQATTVLYDLTVASYQIQSSVVYNTFESAGFFYVLGKLNPFS